ncbi:hypothetical protein WJX84_007718 [Apatococcus fuscideae]|uniref:peptidylprolyl isomerase n=1 Tax=Apatococcus fuscideae TaxID=2026836 RepID=A0AAW1SZS8_9CHLO
MTEEDRPAEVAHETTSADSSRREQQLTGDGGVVKRILKEGTGIEAPDKGDEVFVHYVGTLENGDKFDSSRDRGDPFKFSLGTGSVIKAWDVGVASMKLGEKAMLICRSDYAYGQHGSPPKIPANATLLFEVELMSWKSIKDISGDKGVIKTVVQEGEDWQKPSEQDEVLVHYSINVKGSTEVLHASKEGGDEFPIDNAPVPMGFATALKTMKRNEKVNLVIQPKYGFPADRRPKGDSGDSVLEASLELVSWKKVEKVTDDGLVVKKTLKESKEWKRPNEEAMVKLHMVGRLQDGTVFDDRGHGSPVEITIDGEEVVEGMDLALLKMKEGEKAEIRIAAQYAFGPEGSSSMAVPVPPNATVFYTVELLSLEKAKEGYEMQDEEKVEEASIRKDKGNALFKQSKFGRASKKYKKAIDLIDYDSKFEGDLRSRSRDIKKGANLNLAACHLRLKQYKDARQACDKVLENDPANVKALYRRAQALMGSQDYLEAEQDIKAALERDASNRDVQALHKRCRTEQAVQNRKEAKLYSNLFAKMSKLPDLDPPAPTASKSGVASEPAVADADMPDVEAPQPASAT